MHKLTNHSSFPILGNGIGSFYDLYNDNGDRHHQQHYLSESSSPSLTDPKYLLNEGLNLDTTIEIEKKATPPSPSPFIKKILIVDDDPDFTLTFKAGLEGYHYGGKKRFEVYTYNDPLLALKEFKPHFYDLLLTDIDMPNMNGFQLCEKIIELDVNIRVCLMSALVVNIHALREVYPKVSFGCYIEMPVTIEYLIKRLSAELD
ncbi:MAG: response regulator [Nitrososphaeraceae archaeon]